MPQVQEVDLETFTQYMRSLEKFNRTFDCRTVMELCNKISQRSVVIVVSKKQLFFKVQLGLNHDNSLLKIAKKFFFDFCMQFYFTTRLDGNKHTSFLWPKFALIMEPHDPNHMIHSFFFEMQLDEPKLIGKCKVL